MVDSLFLLFSQDWWILTWQSLSQVDALTYVHVRIRMNLLVAKHSIYDRRMVGTLDCVPSYRYHPSRDDWWEPVPISLILSHYPDRPEMDDGNPSQYP